MNKEPCDVFHAYDAGSKLANTSEELKPEAGSIPVQTGLCACEGDILAGESATEDIWSLCSIRLDCGVGHSERSHVVIDRDTGPVFTEDVLTERVLFTEPHRPESRSFKPKVEAANTGKE
jgi:hypothetical protein